MSNRERQWTKLTKRYISEETLIRCWDCKLHRNDYFVNWNGRSLAISGFVPNKSWVVLRISDTCSILVPILRLFRRFE